MINSVAEIVLLQARAGSGGFGKWYGIHQLAVQGEQLSSDPAGAEEVFTEFCSFVKEKGFKMEKPFNCDETGLNYRLLPSVTIVPSFKKHASERKKALIILTIVHSVTLVAHILICSVCHY